MIVVRVLFLVMNQTGVRLVHNQKENCHYDHILFILKGNIKRAETGDCDWLPSKYDDKNSGNYFDGAFNLINICICYGSSSLCVVV